MGIRKKINKNKADEIQELPSQEQPAASKEQPAQDSEEKGDLQDELNVDASMFSEQELRGMQGRIEQFLVQLKKSEDAILDRRLRTRPLKKVLVLPMIILSACVCLAIFISTSIFGVPQGQSWVDGLFTERVISQDTAAELSEATREIIAGIQDDDESQAVSLFIDLINAENAEVSATVTESEEESAEVAARKEEINRDIAALQAEQEAALEEQRLALEAQGIALQEQESQFQSLQDEFAALSGRYQRANLQVDQYSAMVAEVGNSLRAEDARRTATALRQLSSLVNSPAVRNNPLFEGLGNVVPVLTYSAELNISLRTRRQELSDAIADANELIASAEEERTALNARIEELTQNINQQGSASADSAAEINRLNTRIEELTQNLDQQGSANADSNAEITRLNARVAELTEDIAQQRAARADSEAEVNLLNSRIAELTRAIDNQQDTAAASSGELAQLNARISALTLENQQLGLELEQTLSELERIRQ